LYLFTGKPYCFPYGKLLDSEFLGYKEYNFKDFGLVSCQITVLIDNSSNFEWEFNNHFPSSWVALDFKKLGEVGCLFQLERCVSVQLTSYAINGEIILFLFIFLMFDRESILILI
jgi:hypothetical protein